MALAEEMKGTSMYCTPHAHNIKSHCVQIQSNCILNCNFIIQATFFNLQLQPNENCVCVVVVAGSILMNDIYRWLFFHVDTYRFDSYTFITFNFRAVRLSFSRARTRSLQISLSIDKTVCITHQMEKKPPIDTGDFKISVTFFPQIFFPTFQRNDCITPNEFAKV